MLFGLRPEGQVWDHHGPEEELAGECSPAQPSAILPAPPPHNLCRRPGHLQESLRSVLWRVEPCTWE